MSSTDESALKRQLTLIDCLGIGINGIVGSGIFLLPAALWRAAGGRAPLAWLIVGGLCCLVALCFAEAAARTDRSGGPYRYAADAFGPYIGFAVGWVTLLSTLLGYAAVARGFGDTASKVFDPAAPGTMAVQLACGMVVLLCIVNIVGVRRSARTGDLISAVKLLSLLLFVGIGMFFVKAANLAALRHAERVGADDVVFVDEGGAVLEGPRSAVVLAVSGSDGNPVLVTPDATAILPSTTQRALFAAASARGVECVYRPVNVTDLLAAQGVWLLSAIMLAARVHTLDGRELAASPFAALIAELIDGQF